MQSESQESSSAVAAATDLMWFANWAFPMAPVRFGKVPGVSADFSGVSREEVERLQRTGQSVSVIWGSAETGVRAGVVCVETDNSGDKDGEGELFRLLGGVVPPGPWMKTANGSIHRLFRLKCSASKTRRCGALLPGVDAPWQTVVRGPGRVWYDLGVGIPEAPPALKKLLVRKKIKVDVGEYHEYVGSDPIGTPQGRQRLQAAVDLIREFNSERGINNALYQKGKDLFKLAAAGHLNPDAVERVLIGLGVSLGGGERGCIDTVRSARRAGSLEPLDLPPNIDNLLLKWASRG